MCVVDSWLSKDAVQFINVTVVAARRYSAQSHAAAAAAAAYEANKSWPSRADTASQSQQVHSATYIFSAVKSGNTALQANKQVCNPATLPLPVIVNAAAGPADHRTHADDTNVTSRPYSNYSNSNFQRPRWQIMQTRVLICIRPTYSRSVAAGTVCAPYTVDMIPWKALDGFSPNMRHWCILGHGRTRQIVR